MDYSSFYGIYTHMSRHCVKSYNLVIPTKWNCILYNRDITCRAKYFVYPFDYIFILNIISGINGVAINKSKFISGRNGYIFTPVCIIGYDCMVFFLKFFCKCKKQFFEGGRKLLL